MSRRPKLIVGDLYLIKDKNSWEPKLNKYVTTEYIGTLMEHGTTATLYKRLGIAHLKKIPGGTYLDVRVECSDYQGLLPGTVLRLFPDGVVHTYVIQKLNPKKLPLYLNWEYGIETILRMLKGTYDKLNSPSTAEPALAPH